MVLPIGVGLFVVGSEKGAVDQRQLLSAAADPGLHLPAPDREAPHRLGPLGHDPEPFSINCSSHSRIGLDDVAAVDGLEQVVSLAQHPLVTGEVVAVCGAHLGDLDVQETPPQRR